MAVDQMHADALAELDRVKRALHEVSVDRNTLARMCADLRDELNTIRGATAGPVAVALTDLMDNMAGLAELAAEHGMAPQTVSNWRRRYDDYPEPLAVLKSGSVYDRRAVAIWRADHLAVPDA